MGLGKEVVVLLDGLARRAVVLDGDFRVAVIGRRLGRPLVERALRRRHMRSLGRTEK